MKKCLKNTKLPVIDDLPEDIICSSCLLPMQYQRKENNQLLWQCFKCGKLYLLPLGSNGEGNETWSPPR